MTEPNHSSRCPICKRAISEDAHSTSFPFCSKKCKDTDLENWMTGAYAIPVAPDDLEDLFSEDEMRSILNGLESDEELH